ncbi:MAG: DUF4129 domain-containing protein [Armatimonadota bacterium]
MTVRGAFVLNLAWVLLLLTLTPVFAAPNQKSPRPNPTTIRGELKQILAQPEYNRVYKQSVMPKWWTKFWEKVGKAIGRAFEWLSRSLSLKGEEAGRVASFVLACIVIIAFLALLVLIIRRLSGRRWATDEDYRDPHLSHYDLPSARPLISEAAKLAESGDYRAAFRCVYLASLSHLDEIGVLRFERSRTNWEYLRELDRGGQDALREQLRPLTIDFDRKFYGREECERADYLRALAVYESIASEASA